MEIDIYKVDSKARATVRDETLHSLGPLNPTIVVREQSGSATPNIASLLDALAIYGKVILVRQVTSGNQMLLSCFEISFFFFTLCRMQDDLSLISFSSPDSALAATRLHGQLVSHTRGSMFAVKMAGVFTTDWWCDGGGEVDDPCGRRDDWQATTEATGATEGADLRGACLSPCSTGGGCGD